MNIVHTLSHHSLRLASPPIGNDHQGTVSRSQMIGLSVSFTGRVLTVYSLYVLIWHRCEFITFTLKKKKKFFFGTVGGLYSLSARSHYVFGRLDIWCNDQPISTSGMRLLYNAHVHNNNLCRHGMYGVAYMVLVCPEGPGLTASDPRPLFGFLPIYTAHNP